MENGIAFDARVPLQGQNVALGAGARDADLRGYAERHVAVRPRQPSLADGRRKLFLRISNGEGLGEGLPPDRHADCK